MGGVEEERLMALRVTLVQGGGVGFDQGEAARRVVAALEAVLSAGQDLTPDLGGGAGTRQMADAIVAALAG
jgi:isocitrate/isopropylmalate dehydrogenase